ncbi:citrate lyase acyl carrier protein [Aerococcaceae bacterium DSM 111176]|nr:citrate lyase acyl carrier protein [Aerococcaceae bacterium DSM 111176]
MVQQGTAGTLESSDVQIIINKGSTEGVNIQLKSDVMKQYGDQIRAVIEGTLDELGITSCDLQVQDQGALDCTIRARLISAIYRASDSLDSIDWEALDQWTV